MGSHGPLYQLVDEAGTVIAHSVAVADSLWARFAGLMLRSSLPAGHGLVLRPCRSIHMFFMRIPLDVLFVDGDGRVVRVIHGIRPWRATWVVPGARAAIELNQGVAAQAAVEKGAVVRLREAPSPAS